MEPMFNFRSLAAMVGEEKAKDVTQEENTSQTYDHPRGESSSSMTDNIDRDEGTSAEVREGHSSPSMGESQPPLQGQGVPGFKLTAASRGNSDFDKAGQQVEYAEINSPSIAQERSQTST